MTSGAAPRPVEVDVDRLAAAATARAGGFVVSRAPGACVRGDEVQLRRAFESLFARVRDAGAAAVRVAVQTAAGEVSVHVEDDGRSGGDEEAARLGAVAPAARWHGGHARCLPLRRATRTTLTLPLAAVVPQGGANDASPRWHRIRNGPFDCR